jgi:signal peptidase II
MMTRIGIRLVLLVTIGATIACDRVTKQVAATTLAGTPSGSFLADTLRLEYAENTRAFLGLSAEWPRPVRTTLFSIGTGMLLLIIAVMAMRAQWSRPALLGLALLVAGGVSNLLDRVMSGSVIDFMNVGLGPVRTGIFNVADVAIMLGAGLVVFVGYRSDAHARMRGSD